MPYVEGEPKELINNDKYIIEMVQWEMSGQCVSMSPRPRFKIHFKKAGKYRNCVITVEDMSQHKCLDIAKDIGDLFG